MPKSKSGRAHLRTRMKQAHNSARRVLDYLQEADQFQEGKSPVAEAGIPVAVSIVVSLCEVLDKIRKAL